MGYNDPYQEMYSDLIEKLIECREMIERIDVQDAKDSLRKDVLNELRMLRVQIIELVE